MPVLLQGALPSTQLSMSIPPQLRWSSQGGHAAHHEESEAEAALSSCCCACSVPHKSAVAAPTQRG